MHVPKRSLLFSRVFHASIFVCFVSIFNECVFTDMWGKNQITWRAEFKADISLDSPVRASGEHRYFLTSTAFVSPLLCFLCLAFLRGREYKAGNRGVTDHDVPKWKVWIEIKCSTWTRSSLQRKLMRCAGSLSSQTGPGGASWDGGLFPGNKRVISLLLQHPPRSPHGAVALESASLLKPSFPPTDAGEPVRGHRRIHGGNHSRSQSWCEKDSHRPISKLLIHLHVSISRCVASLLPDWKWNVSRISSLFCESCLV